MEKNPDGSLSPQPQDPLASSGQRQRSDSLPFGKPGPYPISLMQVSVKSQAKPDLKAKPARLKMPSPQASLLVPPEALPMWVGAPEHPS